MTHPLDSLIDEIVGKAAADGALDDLPGAGKPLPELDRPQNALMSKMMTEARATPLVVQLQRDIKASATRLKTLVSDSARRDEMQVLADLQTRLAIEVEALRKYG